MAVEVAIIITDTPPLITLAAAQRLDYLLYPTLPVIIPDAVFYEATGQIDRLGAQEIIDWQRRHHTAVLIEPTEAFKNELQRLARQGGRLEKDLGEHAAVCASSRKPDVFSRLTPYSKPPANAVVILQ
jgi:hypothetical protein